MIPLRGTPLKAAIPEKVVLAVPTTAPLRVKVMALPLISDPPELKVADRLTVPPAMPNVLAMDKVVESWLTIKFWTLDVPPPGAGSKTVTLNVPPEVRAVEGIKAVN